MFSPSPTEANPVIGRSSRLNATPCKYRDVAAVVLNYNSKLHLSLASFFLCRASRFFFLTFCLLPFLYPLIAFVFLLDYPSTFSLPSFSFPLPLTSHFLYIILAVSSCLPSTFWSVVSYLEIALRSASSHHGDVKDHQDYYPAHH